jgi:GNAT superfamily N-acetyltransferase
VKPRFEIRLAMPFDLPRLAEIERNAATRFTPYGLAELYGTMLMPLEALEQALAGGRLWVATAEDDVLVGFAVAAVVGENAHLDEVDVHPDHGRRGIGAALVGEVCAWARTAGFEAITLTTLREVPWNAPFYERLGFRVLPEEEWTDALRELVEDEERRGLPVADRVAMKRDL